ncbi:MAG TPA: phage portal protein [Aggregatilinea sp.]|uniref:phage portal protein n=1 Tax=Aggregatilinea sp. TaxID=2806333 RepID=UPI002B57293A|nr:phage portal protein [Aggregatilinea sp.]HML22099.1 phage portal protein [Aggregatilinea sp.]
MSVFLVSRADHERAFRADLDTFVSNALNAPEATVRDLARLYATSTTAYRAANIRATVLSQVPFRVVDRDGKPLDDHPLNQLMRHNADMPDILMRAELSLCFFGDTLIFKRRMVSGRVTGLQWVNPNVYEPMVDTHGLRGFRIIHYGGTYDQVAADFIAPNDGIYLHGVDFDDDYGGVSPAENAFEQAGVEAEAALTALSFMRNRAIPLSVLQPADKDTTAPSKETRNKMIDLLRRVTQGARNAGRTLVSSGRWEWVQLQQKFDEVGMEKFYEEARIAVSMAFDVPLDLLLPSESSYAAHYQSNKGWVDYWLRPRANWYARSMTKQLAGELDNEVRLEPDLSAVLQQDKQAQTSVVNAQLQAGYLTLYQAQVDAGVKEPDESLKDYYMFGGVPVHKDRIPLLSDRLLLGTSHVPMPSPITLTSGAGDSLDDEPAQLAPRPPAPEAPLSGTTPAQALPAGSAVAPSAPAPTGSPANAGEQRTVDEITRLLEKGVITFNEARLQLGQDAITGGDYFWMPRDKVPVTVSQMDKVPELTASVPVGRGETATAGAELEQVIGSESDPTAQPPAPAKSAARMSSDGTPSATVLLRLENTRTVEAIQAHLRLLLPDDEAIRWTRPEDLHVTLVSIPVLSDALAMEMQAAFGPTIGRAVIGVGPVATFKQDDQVVVILDVQPDDSLRELQEQMVTWCAQHQIPVSPYSMPGDWHPHITLAYSALMDVQIPTWEETVSVHTDRIELSRTAYQTNWVIPPIRAGGRTIRLLPPAQFDELITASRVLARRGGDYAFTPDALPSDAVALLRVLATTGEAQDAMYDQVRRLLLAGPSAARANTDYATLETTYRAALYELIRSAFAHEVDRRVFGDRGRREISRAFEGAYLAGLSEAGMKDGESLTEDETVTLKSLQKEERSYWTALANELYRTALPLWDESQDLLAQLDGESDPNERDRLRSESLQTLVKFYRVRDQFLARVDMWTKTLRGVYHQALLSGKKNPMVIWTLGQTEEHCKSCLAAAGQVHRRSTWDKAGVRPQSRTLECTGRKCDCSLEVTDQKAQGNIRKIPLFSADRAAPGEHPHDHEHEHDQDAEVAHV